MLTVIQLNKAAQNAPMDVWNASAQLTALANLLEEKLNSENEAPKGYGMEPDSKGGAWAFGQAPAWATGTRYYMASIKSAVKTMPLPDSTKDLISIMKNPHVLATSAHHAASNMLAPYAR